MCHCHIINCIRYSNCCICSNQVVGSKQTGTESILTTQYSLKEGVQFHSVNFFSKIIIIPLIVNYICIPLELVYCPILMTNELQYDPLIQKQQIGVHVEEVSSRSVVILLSNLSHIYMANFGQQQRSTKQQVRLATGQVVVQ